MVIRFKNIPNKIYCKTEEQYTSMLKIMEKYTNIRWSEGQKPTEWTDWSDDDNGITLKIDKVFGDMSQIKTYVASAVDFDKVLPAHIKCDNRIEATQLFSVLKDFGYHWGNGSTVVFDTFTYPVLIHLGLHNDPFVIGWDIYRIVEDRYDVTTFTSIFDVDNTKEYDMEAEEIELGPVGTQLFQQQYPTNVLTDEEFAYLKKEMITLLETYNYEYEEEHLDTIIEEWNNQKGWLINLLKKSPYYVEGKFLIKMPVEYHLGIDTKKVADVKAWFKTRLNKWIKNNEVRTRFFTYTEIANICESLSTKYNLLNKCRDYGIDANYHGMSMSEIEEEYTMYHNIKDHLHYSSVPAGDYDTRISEDKARLVQEGSALINVLADIENYVDKEGKISENGELTLNGSTFPHSKGMKFMRYFSKVCEAFGFDKVVEMRDISFTDQNGNYKEKEKDFGYKYQRASLGDAISQPKVKDELYISVNPIDWLTMSFLNKVASCHTIDKENMRRCSSTYSGEYSSGTISYMLDDVSFMAYELYKGTDYKEYQGELSDDITRKTKQRRAVYVLDDNKLFMSILYPDGRDGGDKDRATYWNDYVKEHIASLLDVDNDWSTTRDVFYDDQIYQTSGSTLYNDFRNGGHGVQCFKNELKIAYKPEKTALKFGAKPICIKCGERHTYNKAIECYDCWNEDNYAYHCERCGDGISEDDYDAIWVGDCVYCCPDCASNDGAEYCEDIEEWTFNWWYSELESCTYSDDEESYTVFKNGYEYEVSNWYRENNCIYDDFAEEYVVESSTDCFYTPDGDRFTEEFYPDYVELPDGYAPNEDYARDWGYVQNDDGDWVSEDELEDDELENNDDEEVVA